MAIRIILLAFMLFLMPANGNPELPETSAPPEITRFLPDDLLGALFIHDADSNLQALRDFMKAQGIESGLFYQALSKDPKFEAFRSALTGLATTSGSDMWSGVFAILGKEIALGIRPGQGKEPQLIGVSITRNPDLLHKMFDGLYKVAGLSALLNPKRKQIRMVGDVPVYSVNPKFHHCYVGDALIFSNHFEMISSSLKNQSNGGKCLADSDAYRTARKRVDANAAVWTFFDLAALRSILPEQGIPPLRINEPVPGLLFGGAWHQIIHGNRIVAWARPEKSKMTLHALVESSEPLPHSHQGYLMSDPAPHTWSMNDLPRFIGGLSLSRDWADLFQERETLYSLSAAGQLVNFTGVLTTLMGGLDVMDELLPRVSGPITFLTARRKYDEQSYETTPKLPAFAIAVKLDKENQAELEQRIRTGALMTLSLVNYQASEKREPAFTIDIENVQGTQVIQARYPQPEPDDSGLVDIRYNFAPAVTLAGDTLVIGSTGRVVRDLIKLIKRNAAGIGRSTMERPHDRMVLDVTALKTILEDNRKELVYARMLDEGESKEEAEAFLRGLFEAMDAVRGLCLTSSTASKQSTMRLELTFRDAAREGGPVR